MTVHDKPVIVYSTWPDAASAEAVGSRLVEAGLVACANILPGMTSIYLWQGERHRDSEVAMLLKTRAGLASRVVGDVQALHPYETPAVLVLPVDGGAQAFIDWIMVTTAEAPV